MDYFPKLAYQALSIFAKTLSEDKLHKPFLRLLPKDHVGDVLRAQRTVCFTPTIV